MHWIEPERARPAPLNMDSLEHRLGKVIGRSRHIVIGQDMISAFGRLTGDEQYIHTDPDRAKDGPFGGTIAHGFLTLALFSALAFDGLPAVDGSVASVNYGFDRIRLVKPVRAGEAVAARFTLTEIQPKANGAVLLRFLTEVTTQGAEVPAVSADWLILHMREQDKRDGQNG